MCPVAAEVWEGLTNLVNEASKIQLFIQVNAVKMWRTGGRPFENHVSQEELEDTPQCSGDGMTRLLFGEDPRDEEVKVKSCAMPKLFRSSMSRHC